MRRRPDVEVRLVPGAVRPGQILEVDATFISRDRVPVDDIAFTLRGIEWVSIPSGRSAVTYRKEHVALVSHYKPEALPAGRHVCRARFPIPTSAPASYRGVRSRIEYDLRVHVDIPWWLDVDQYYEVPVAPRASAPHTPKSGVFCSHAGGPAGKELYAEASLDDVVVEPGGVLTGAVSFVNVAYHKIRGIEVVFVARERYQTHYGNASMEARRYRAIVHAGSPADGESRTFRVIVPPDAPVSFESTHLSVGWQLEVVIDGGWKKRAVLSIPIVVASPSAGTATARRTRPALPSVGRERRVQIWSLVARRLGVAYDPESETVQLTSGDVRATVGLESRGADGFYTAAQMEWPALGMDLEVGPSAWTDRFSSEEIALGDSKFDERFRVRGRVPGQVKHLLGGLGAALLDFDEARLTDDGATFSRRGAGNSDAAVASFIRDVRELCEALAAQIDALPPPPRLAPHLDAWRTFASRLQGRLERGRVWIHDGSFGIDRVEIGCQWERTGAFGATVIRLALDPAVDPPLDRNEADPRWTDASRALAMEIGSGSSDLHIGPDAIVVERAEPVENPATLEPLLEKMARLARALHGRAEVGPYR